MSQLFVLERKHGEFSLYTKHSGKQLQDAQIIIKTQIKCEMNITR